MPETRLTERRFLPLVSAGIEIRTTDDGARGIRGVAAVTNSVSIDLGGFTEEIAPGAFSDALKHSDVRGLFNHDPNYVLGRSGRTMKVWENDDGLQYDIPKLPDARADVLESIERGDVDGNSFSFTVEEDEWGTRNGVPHRTITKFQELFDVGPVTFPAFTDTTVSVRSLERASTIQQEIDAMSDDAPTVEERLKKLEQRNKELDQRNEILERRVKLLEAEARI